MADAACTRCGVALEEDDGALSPLCPSCLAELGSDVVCSRCGKTINASESCYTDGAEPVCLRCNDMASLDRVMASSADEDRAQRFSRRLQLGALTTIVGCEAAARGLDWPAFHLVAVGVTVLVLPQALLEVVFPGRRREERFVLGVVTALSFVGWLAWREIASRPEPPPGVIPCENAPCSTFRSLPPQP